MRLISVAALFFVAFLAVNFRCGDDKPANPGPAAGSTLDSTSTRGAFTVRVDTIGPLHWHYTVKLTQSYYYDSSSSIKSVELISSSERTCNVTLEPYNLGKWKIDSTSSSILLKTDILFNKEVGFGVTCERRNGPVYLKVTGDGFIPAPFTRTLGPVPGPVE